MATVGVTTTGAVEISIEQNIHAVPATMSEAGSITAVSFYGCESTSANIHTVKAIIFDGSGNILGQSSERTDIGLTLGWWELTFGTAVEVSASQAIIIGVVCGVGSGQINIYGTTGATGVGKTASITYPTIADPTTFSDTTTAYPVYATYTPGAASAATKSSFYSMLRRNN